MSGPIVGCRRRWLRTRFRRNRRIRVALGAKRGDLLRLAIRQGLLPAVLGSAVGLVVAAGLSRLISHLLFGVSATDAPTFALAAGLFVLVAFAASYPPAHRIAAQDPMIALHHE
ncbi:MAG: FtsX-like permease family protein [Luteitalea sp.]|nr:FtsX-like permease family protein [Luteitalea sp.]